MNIIDISSDLLRAEVYPGDPEPRVHAIQRLDNDDEFDVTALYACLHSGTHVDAPSHVFSQTEDPDFYKTVTDLPLEKFIGPVTVVDIPPGPLTGREIERYFPRFSDRIILRCQGDYEFFAGAADDVAALGYELLGFEGLAHGGKNEAAFHRALLGAGTALLEGLDLSALNRGGDYFLFAPPVKLDGLEAAPARAILIEDHIIWRK